MNNSSEITANAKLFVKKWQGRGKERQDDKTFWEDLLEDVFGVEKARGIIEVQKPVKFQGSTKAIDIYIKPSKVVIEQKSKGVSLDKKEEQSDKTMLSPFDQAQRYYNWLDQPEQGMNDWLLPRQASSCVCFTRNCVRIIRVRINQCFIL